MIRFVDYCLLWLLLGENAVVVKYYHELDMDRTHVSVKDASSKVNIFNNHDLHADIAGLNSNNKHTDTPHKNDSMKRVQLAYTPVHSSSKTHSSSVSVSVSSTSVSTTMNPILFSTSSFFSSNQYIKLVGLVVSIITGLVESTPNECSTHVCHSLIRSFVPYIIRYCYMIESIVSNYIALYCEHYNTYNIKLLRSSALKQLPEIDSLLQTIQHCSSTIIITYLDIFTNTMRMENLFKNCFSANELVYIKQLTSAHSNKGNSTHR